MSCVAIVGFWLIGLRNELFFLYWWRDIPLHFLGGLWVYFLVKYLANISNVNISSTWPHVSEFAIFLGFVMLIGVFWEFFELVLDRFIMHNGFTYLSGVYEDTLSDLLCDFFGGTAGFILFNKKSA